MKFVRGKLSVINAGRKMEGELRIDEKALEPMVKKIVIDFLSQKREDTEDLNDYIG